MRILHTTLGFYPATTWGGPVKIVYENGKELVRRGHDITIFCTNLLDKKHKIQSGTFERNIDGMRVVYFNTWSFPWWPGTLGPIWLPDLQSYLEREIKRFDLVHINGYRNLMILPVVRTALKAGVPIVVQPHGAIPVIINSLLVKQAYDLFLGKHELKGISALIALQESERKQAIAHGVSSDKIQIIFNGLDLSERIRLPEKGTFRRLLGIPEDTPLILFLGRINRIKGTDMLVEAFSKLKDRNYHLAIVGPDDGQLDEVKSLISKYNLTKRVSMPGLLSEKEVFSAYQDADLFVLPCRVDAFPTTIMESCMMNTPMVVTDRCETADLIDGRVADVVPFDAGLFAQAMENLLTDAERYRRYQANCSVVMNEAFSLSVTVDKLEALYERVVATK